MATTAYLITAYPVILPETYTVQELLYEESVAIFAVDEDTEDIDTDLKQAGIAYVEGRFSTQALAHQFVLAKFAPPTFVYLLTPPHQAVNDYIGFGAAIVHVLPNAFVIRVSTYWLDWNKQRLFSGMHNRTQQIYATQAEAIAMAQDL